MSNLYTFKGNPILISGGDINLGGYDFCTIGYHPPQYQRSIAFADNPQVSADGTTLTMTRVVDDLGPLLGSWKPFKITCYFGDMYDQGEQPYRGELIYSNLKKVFAIVGEPIRLWDYYERHEYWVMFDSSGLAVELATPNRAAALDPVTQERLGAEYEVQVGLVEVPPPTSY